MIELINILGFSLMEIFIKSKDLYTYVQVMNATISICITFILFGRVFIHVCVDKVWSASFRYFFLCLFYILLLVDGVLAILYFSNFMLTWNPIWKTICQIAMYGIGFAMFLFVKISNFMDRKRYPAQYLIYHSIDTILVLLCLFLDFYITPNILLVHRSFITLIKVLMILLAITNCALLYKLNYWVHKKVLLIKLKNDIQNKNIERLTKRPNTLKKANSTIKECAYVLDNATFRVIEMVLLTKQVHDICLDNGYNNSEATIIAADFNSVILKTLMKRKEDFYLVPKPLLKFLQTISITGKQYKRSLTLNI